MLTGRKNRPRSATQSSMAHIVRRAQISWLYAHPRLFLFSPHDSLSLKQKAARRLHRGILRADDKITRVHLSGPPQTKVIARHPPTYIFVYPHRTCNRDSHTLSGWIIILYFSLCALRHCRPHTLINERFALSWKSRRRETFACLN